MTNDELAALHAAHDKALRRAVWPYARAPEDLDDVMQAVWLKVLTTAAPFRAENGAAVRSWLTRVAINAALERLRARRCRQDYEEPLEREGTDGAAIIIDTADPRGGGQATWEVQHDLAVVLGRLAPTHCKTLIDYYVYGQTPVNSPTERSRRYNAIRAAREAATQLKEGKMTEELRQVRCADCSAAQPSLAASGSRM